MPAEQQPGEWAAERAEAMRVLAPSMPSSGLVDACKQVKQVAISEADNSEQAEADLTRLRDGLAALEQAFNSKYFGHNKAERDEFKRKIAALREGQ